MRSVVQGVGMGHSTCPVHGPGCFGIPDECVWIAQDMERRVQAGECFRCGAQVASCSACSGESAYYREQEAAFEAERFALTGMGLA